VLKIGLTGGIGCGKTTVANIFAQYQIPVIDADQVSHDLVTIGQPALKLIEQEFGTESLNADGSLNRNYIRELVFDNIKQKQKLEEIIHPLVFQTIEKQLAQLATPYCIICIPLLFETNRADFVDRILVIDCPVETQIGRVMKRDKLSIERIQSIIASQVTREFRVSHADDVIDNSKTNVQLAQQAEKLHNLYISLSFPG
jgi:dephospho-CoA kinase